MPTPSYGKECQVRRQIVRMIEQARTPTHEPGLEGQTETALRLASETIRLARLAASTHMILAARHVHTDAPPPARPLVTERQP